MRDHLMKIPVSILLILLFAAGLSACGRKGPLEAPDSAVVVMPDGTEKKTEEVEDRPFILDGLI